MQFGYKVVVLHAAGERELEARFNQLGDEGWELVTITNAHSVEGGGSGHIVAIFKRQVVRQIGSLTGRIDKSRRET